MIVLVWILLFAIWFWLIKDELMALISENARITAGGSGVKIGTQDNTLVSYNLFSPKMVEFIVGVLGILLFFMLGWLLSA